MHILFHDSTLMNKEKQMFLIIQTQKETDRYILVNQTCQQGNGLVEQGIVNFAKYLVSIPIFCWSLFFSRFLFLLMTPAIVQWQECMLCCCAEHKRGSRWNLTMSSNKLLACKLFPWAALVQLHKQVLSLHSMLFKYFFRYFLDLKTRRWQFQKEIGAVFLCTCVMPSYSVPSCSP